MRLCWITAQTDGTEHVVTDDAQMASMAAGKGVYEGLCGADFLAACMDVGPRDRCSKCLAFLRARARARDLDERMGRQRGLLSRLFRHNKQPAGVGWLAPETPIPAGLHQPSGVDVR